MNMFHWTLFRCTFALVALFLHAAIAAGGGKSWFEIPAGPAEKTLRLFTAQCGLQVGFPSEIARGVRTNPVKGEYMPEEAAILMLAGTKLKLLKDERSGAYAVVKDAPTEKNESGAERTAANSTSAPIANVSAANDATGQNDLIELSPFTVTGVSDRGYVATDTLAGTRLRTELKDTPAALTVLTNDFLNDIAATSAESVAEFVPSTEVLTVIGGEEMGRSNKVGEAFQMRGFATSTRTRNFFNSLGESDRYLTDRITFSRGPNALLFGIGNPGGAVHVSTNKAHFRGNTGAVDLNYDSYDGRRVSLDQNVELVEGRLAMRGDFLWTDTAKFQWPSSEKKKGVFLTTTWNPFGPKGRTQLRANYEYGDTFRIAPPPFAPYDYFSGWVDAGAQLFDNRSGARPGTVPTVTSPFVLQERRFVDVRGQTAIPIFYTARTSGFNSYVRSSGQIVNGTEATSSSIMSDFVSLNPLDLLRRKLGSEEALENWLVALGTMRSIPEQWRGGKTVTVPMDAWIGGKMDFYKRRFNAMSLFLEQRVGSNLFVELAGNLENLKTRSFEPVRYNDIAIAYDPNLYLPGGRPNPYAGMPYVGHMGFYSSDQIVHNENHEYRATATYNLDLTVHRLGRFFDLGRHQVALLCNVYQQDQKYNLEKMPVITKWEGSWTDQNSPLGTTVQSMGVQQASVRLSSRQYLLPGNVPYITESWFPVNGDATRVQADWVTYGATSGGSISRAAAISTQSMFLDDRLVVTAGLRRDTLHNRQNTASRFDANSADPNAGNYYGEVDEKRSFDSESWLPKKGWSTRSVGAVGHLVRNWRKLDYVSVFYNRGTSVSGVQERYDINFTRITPLSGLGVDYGVRFSAMGGRLVANLTRFETTQTNNYANTNFRFGRLGFNDAYSVLEIVEPNSEILARKRNTTIAWTPIFDSVTKGNEIELVWNATDNLRIRGTFSKHENIYSRFGADLENFVAEHRSAWQDFVSAHYDPSFKGAIDPARPTLEEQRKIDADFVRASLVSMEKEIPLKKALNGVPSVGVPYAQASIAINYALPDSGWWRGLSLGTNIRYRGQAPLAFKTDTNGVVDRSLGFEARAMTKVDCSLSYRRRFPSAKYIWRTQLTVRNVLDERRPLLLSAEWDVPSSRFVVRRNQITEPLAWVLTSSLGW